MVAVLVAIPRQPCARGLTAAPPEPRDRAGTLGDASSALVDAVNDLMRLLDNISHFLSHKMNNHNQHHIIVGTVKQHGCDPVHGGIHNHIGNWTSCGVHDDFEQPEVKPFHPDLLGKHLDHDGIVRANLEITACTASNFDTNEGSVITAAHVGVRVLYGQHPRMACNSTSTSSLKLLHGIHVGCGESSIPSSAPEREPFKEGIVHM
jgi:hypothetical protein